MRIGVVPLALGLAVAFAATSAEQGFVTLTPEQIEWRDVPGMDGVRVALLAGSPNEAGLYVMRVRFAAGVMSRPHTHDRDRFVTVLDGTWHAGTQRTFDPEATVALGPGSFMIHPAGAVHYDGARDAPVVVEIRGIGPVTTDYIEALAPDVRTPGSPS